MKTRNSLYSETSVCTMMVTYGPRSDDRWWCNMTKTEMVWVLKLWMTHVESGCKIVVWNTEVQGCLAEVGPPYWSFVPKDTPSFMFHGQHPGKGCTGSWPLVTITIKWCEHWLTLLKHLLHVAQSMIRMASQVQLQIIGYNLKGSKSRYLYTEWHNRLLYCNAIDTAIVLQRFWTFLLIPSFSHWKPEKKMFKNVGARWPCLWRMQYMHALMRPQSSKVNNVYPPLTNIRKAFCMQSCD